MRTIKYLVLGLVALCLLIVGFANRELVALVLLPESIATFARFNASITLPLYVVVFGGFVIGLLLGFVWEWAREHKHRAEAVKQRREKTKLAGEVQKLKADRNTHDDDVLALLDKPGTAR